MLISDQILNRKGATKASLLSEEIKNLLNKGFLASVNLTEWLAVDHEILIKNVLPEKYQPACLLALSELKQKTAMQSTLAIGQALVEANKEEKSQKLFNLLANHVSDSVRCWATYLVGLDIDITIEKKLDKIKYFAADKHFGVREIAWMAMRASIDENLEQAIPILSEWSYDKDSNIRRFGSEATRPRGVWCKHIEILKEYPEKALSILEPLKSDHEKYV